MSLAMTPAEQPETAPETLPEHKTRIHIRQVTPERRAAWEYAAELDGRPLSNWIRFHLDRAADAAIRAADPDELVRPV